MAAADPSPAPLLERVAGAPITWGVDGSPGWGHLMDADRVLAEMVEVGLRATELGPDGYLGATTEEVLARLERFDLRLVGGFVPVLLYRPDTAEADLAGFDAALATLQAGGATVAVLGADTTLPGYDTRVDLDAEERRLVATNLQRCVALAAARDMTVATHPHWGMAIEDTRDVELLLEQTTSAICLDTGHLALAEVDMAWLVAVAADRIHHVHLKDVDPAMADKVRAGSVPFRQAVIEGLFRPLGEGDVDIAGVVAALEDRGFGGWYVLEQDCALDADPPAGEGPIADARRSVAFLRDLAARRSGAR